MAARRLGNSPFCCATAADPVSWPGDSEQRWRRRRTGPRARLAQVRPCSFGGHASTGRALDEAALDQERLVGVLDRVRLLAHTLRQCRQTDRLTPETGAQ